ncbi:hypothetical protein MWU78_14280 [Arenibacter sp. F26102]|uniref:Flavodoxin-like domain-containing protein n=1 Tax=Arenibacter arenosicollis TaxID=2762274 RepID=A0ABR7QHX1_9FLAO|nr:MULTISPECIES: hypothetical protein [Arenibacter]MBC8766747.1 hypothetical protein [Arenibacter arenosicollis]MCK0146821.1 hypothetical protein [Arenibacter sp. F26102]
MNKVKKFSLIFLSIVVVFLLFMLWYQNEYAMDIAEEYEVNSPMENSKLLIATQGSTFKNTITTAIVEYYKSESIYIKIIDVSALADVNPTNYNALLIIHTWEMWKPPASIKSFMDRTVDDRGKMVVLTTSGEGTYKMEGIDAITGESILDETPLYVGKIINELNPLIKLYTSQ